MDISMLGADQSDETADLSRDHALKQGMHDAIADIMKYTVLGGCILIIAGVVLKKKTAKKILQQFTGA